MQRNSKEVSDADTNGLPRFEAGSLLRALSNTPISLILSPEAKDVAKRQLLRRLAEFSSRHAEELRNLKEAQAQSRCRRENLEWAAQFSTRAEAKLRVLQTGEADGARHVDRYSEPLFGVHPARNNVKARAHSDHSSAKIVEWDPDQPRQPKGTAQGGQWASRGNGGFLDHVIRRNKMVAELTGHVTPALAHSSRLAANLQTATRLPQEVITAAAAGLVTGGKAVVNGSATAVKNVATLGLSSSQLELIGVTAEDRAGGYDTAVSIATASGQVLIAVGTSGLATALSKGGTVARTASGVLVAYDAAGNAVGTVQGAYDATQNGINLENGLKIAGGALGLAASVKAAHELKRAAAAARLREVEAFIADCPRTNTPTRTAANRYEIAQAGPYNYEVSVRGFHAEIDGYRGTTILEAKHVGYVKSSPYVPGSRCPNSTRRKVVRKLGDQLTRLRRIIRSGETPFKSVEIITNTPESKAFFERMLNVFEVPGTVRLAI
jgi:hypothetical protein